MIIWLVGAVISILLTLVVGIPLVASGATLFVWGLSTYLIEVAVEKIKAKQMPNVMEWITYALVFVALILGEIGLFYTNIYVFLVALLLLIVAVILIIVEKKRGAKTAE